MPNSSSLRSEKENPMNSSEPDVQFHSCCLPPEIIRDILTRLPVKSLTRFQCVAKGWSRLFKTPDFIEEHLRRAAQKNPSLLLQRDYPGSSPQRMSVCCLGIDLDQLEVHTPLLINSMSRARIVGSCNGLLCIRYVADHGFSELLALWNPATRQVKQVPGTIIDFKGVCYVGFGFTSVFNDYKILRILVRDNFFEDEAVFLDEGCVSRVEMYSLSTGSWKDVEAGILKTLYLKQDSVSVNGAMFWLGSEIGDLHCSDLLISFNIGEEVFTKTKLPASAAVKSSNNKLTVYRESLALFSQFIIGDFESSLFDLWVMEDICATGKSWIKQFTIGPFTGIVHPLNTWRNEIVCVVETQEFNIGNGEISVLSLYNPSSNELKNLPAHSVVCSYLVLNYAESLVPVDNIRTEDVLACFHSSSENDTILVNSNNAPSSSLYRSLNWRGGELHSDVLALVERPCHDTIDNASLFLENASSVLGFPSKNEYIIDIHLKFICGNSVCTISL